MKHTLAATMLLTLLCLAQSSPRANAQNADSRGEAAHMSPSEATWAPAFSEVRHGDECVIYNPVGAIKSYQKALKLFPHFYNANIGLGTACVSVGRYSEAVSAFEEVYSDPTLGKLELASQPDTLMTYVIALCQTGRTVEALPIARRAMQKQGASYPKHLSVPLPDISSDMSKEPGLSSLLQAIAHVVIAADWKPVFHSSSPAVCDESLTQVTHTEAATKLLPRAGWTHYYLASMLLNHNPHAGTPFENDPLLAPNLDDRRRARAELLLAAGSGEANVQDVSQKMLSNRSLFGDAE